MIKLYAMVETEGTAIVEIGTDIPKEYYLVRPPYQEGRKVRVNEKTLASAVCKHDFSMAETGKEFDNYAPLFKFLNQKVVEARKRAGLSIPTPEEIKEIMEDFA